MSRWSVIVLSMLGLVHCGPSQPAADPSDPLTQGIPAPGESRANPDPQWGTSGSAPGVRGGKTSPSSTPPATPAPTFK